MQALKKSIFYYNVDMLKTPLTKSILRTTDNYIKALEK